MQRKVRRPALNSCRASVSPICVQIAVQSQGILPKTLRHFPPFLHHILQYLKLGHDHFFHSLSLLILTDLPITLATEAVVSFQIERLFCTTSQFHHKSPNCTPFAVQRFCYRRLAASASHNDITFIYRFSALGVVPIAMQFISLPRLSHLRCGASVPPISQILPSSVFVSPVRTVQNLGI